MHLLCGATLGTTLMLGSLAIIPETSFAKDLLMVCYNDNEWCCEYEYEGGELTTLDCYTGGSY